MPTGVYIVLGIAVVLVLIGVWASRSIRKEREEVGEGLRALGLTYHPRESVNPRKAHRILMAEGTYRGLPVTVEDDFPRRPGGDGTVISLESRIQSDGFALPDGRLASRKLSREPVAGMRTERTGIPELDEAFELSVAEADGTETWRRIAALPSLQAMALDAAGGHRLVHLEAAGGQVTVQLYRHTVPAERVRAVLDALLDVKRTTESS